MVKEEEDILKKLQAHINEHSLQVVRELLQHYEQRILGRFADCSVEEMQGLQGELRAHKLLLLRLQGFKAKNT